MKLFLGLGNLGDEYQLNRHNIGFMFLDYLAVLFQSWTSNWQLNKKLEAQISSIKHDGDEEILLAKPQTFMNDSGRSAIKIINYYHLDIENNFLLIHDDLDLQFGSYKITKDKKPISHNGVNSVIKSLSSTNFYYLRFGIGSQIHQQIKASGKSVAEEFVLKNFSKQEQDLLLDLFNQALVELRLKINF